MSRPHIGGNAYDCHDAHGILIHKYGPHIFHTNSDEIVDYLSQFTEWRPYEHRVLASVDGQLVPIPINLDTINRLYGRSSGHKLRAGQQELIDRLLPAITVPTEGEVTARTTKPGGADRRSCRRAT